MDLNRYLDLYLSETQEHLRALSRGLLALESGAGEGAIEEAFRAAHTIKGMSATMGYRRVADLAHRLEDGLDAIRSGAESVDAGRVDALLEHLDALEAAVEEAVSEPAGPMPEAAEATPGPLHDAPDADAPEGTAAVVRVVLDPAAPMKAVRAAIVRSRVEQTATVLGVVPEQYGDDFDGVLWLFIGPGADHDAVEATARAAGEVADVAVMAPGAVGAAEREPAAPSEPEPASGAEARREASAAAGRTRYVRVEQSRLDDLANGLGELGILRRRMEQLVALGADGAMADLVDRAGRLIGDLQDAALAMRMVPVSDVFDRFPRVVRDAARSLDKEIDFRIEGRGIELDRAILDEIADPLVHLLRNAVDHGIEAPDVRAAAGKPRRGRLTLRASRERSSVLIEVEDDGRGVSRSRVLERARSAGLTIDETAESLSDDQLLRLMSRSGFSTAERVTEVSGRGVGMDVVTNRVRSLGGAIDLRTREGQGSRISLRLPLTLAIAHALRVRIGPEDYAIPLTHVSEAIEIEDGMLGRVQGREVLRVRDDVLPLVRLGSVLQAPDAEADRAAVVTEIGERRTALAVSALVGREQIVIKAFDAAAGTLAIFSGVTLLADGRPALVLDPVSVL